MSLYSAAVLLFVLLVVLKVLLEAFDSRGK